MNKQKNTANSSVLIISLAALCGLVAGVSGELMMHAFFPNTSSLPYMGQELNLSSLNNSNSNLVISDPKKVVVNQDVKVSETVSSVSSSMVSVFKDLGTPGNDPASSKYYSLEDPLFVGLVMTSDGWTMASLSADQLEAFTSKGSFVAWSYDHKSYKIDKVVPISDLPGNLVFFHLAQASNLPVRKVAERSDLSLGQSLLALDGNKDVWPTALASLKRTAGVLSSEALTARLSLTDSSAFKNSLVFDLSGNLAAIVDSNGDIIPAFSYDSYWRQFWGKQAVARPSLGVRYLDLSLVSFPNISAAKGALIYPAGKTAAVVKGGPADKAGLQAGDIITWIDNQEINASADLADIISQYKPGDKVTVTYSRDGQEKAVDVQLGQASNK